MVGFNEMMSNIKNMQSRMSEMQAELEAMQIVGQAGAGMVVVTLNGKGDMLSAKIDPSLFREEDVEVVEDLIAAAHKDAKAAVEARMQEKMADITGGLPLPPGLGLSGA